MESQLNCVDRHRNPRLPALGGGVWSESEREAFITFISDNPLAGDVIPGAGNLRKLRWKRDGMGKSGGARVIYYLRLANGEVVLVAVYAKAKFDNMPVEVLKSWKEAYDA